MAQHDPFEKFEQSFQAALDYLISQSDDDDETLSTLTFMEEAADNVGIGDYVPEWLSSYVSIAGQMMLNQMGELLDEADEESLGKFMAALIPTVAHAVRLGYVEGYAEAKGD